MVTPLDLVQRVPHRLQKVAVGGENVAVHIELDHSLGLLDGCQLSSVFGCPITRLGHICGVFDDLEGSTRGIEDRVVARLNPDFAAILGDPFVGPLVELAECQLLPEQSISVGSTVLGRDKHAVVLADDLILRVPGRGEKIVVRTNNRAIQFKLDDCL